jgi:hypothetical protein
MRQEKKAWCTEFSATDAVDNGRTAWKRFNNGSFFAQVLLDRSDRHDLVPRRRIARVHARVGYQLLSEAHRIVKVSIVDH